MPAELIELSNALAEITEKTAAAAVAVHSEPRGSSSGVIWRKGIVVTADHALQRDEEIRVTLPDGRIVGAELAGRDPSSDVAVLKCADAASSTAEFGGADSLKPGNLALVVGRTRASGPVAAMAVVSLVAAERRSWTGGALAPYVRLDVGLQPTAVGGAVVDARGRIAGVATPRFARFGAIVVATALVNRTVEALLQNGRIPRGYLGVGLQTVRLPEALLNSLQRKEKTAAILLEVEPNGPAHKAGLVIGDILISLSGNPVSRCEDVQSHLQVDNIGKSLEARIVRGGAVQDLRLNVVERPTGDK